VACTIVIRVVRPETEGQLPISCRSGLIGPPLPSKIVSDPQLLPTVGRLGLERLFFCAAPTAQRCRSPEAVGPLSSFRYPQPFEATQGNNTTPIVDEQRVIYTGQGKGLFALRIEAQGDEFAATPIWTNAQLGARFTTPILKDNLLFGYNGHLFCADAKTGATLWTDTTNRGNSAALVDAGQVMLATTVSSELVAFEPNAKEYTELASMKVADTEIWAHPVVDGSRIYVRDRESVTLWAIE
jgi:PQQ-like domain